MFRAVIGRWALRSRLVVAGILFVVATIGAYGQYTAPYAWHEPYGPWALLFHPLEANIDAALPDIGHINTVTVIGNTPWIAGNAGLLAFGDADGRQWTRLSYNQATGSFARMPVAATGPAAAGAWRFDRFVVTPVYAAQQQQQAPNTSIERSALVMTSRVGIFSPTNNTQAITLQSRNGEGAKFDGIRIVPANGPFRITQIDPRTCAEGYVEPKQECRVVVVFQPGSPGMYDATLFAGAPIAALHGNAEADTQSKAQQVPNAPLPTPPQPAPAPAPAPSPAAQRVIVETATPNPRPTPPPAVVPPASKPLVTTPVPTSPAPNPAPSIQGLDLIAFGDCRTGSCEVSTRAHTFRTTDGMTWTLATVGGGMPQTQPIKVTSTGGRLWQLNGDALTRSDDNGSTFVPVDRAAAEARGHAPVSRNAQYWSMIAPWYPLVVLVLGLLVSIDDVVPVTNKAIAPEGKSDTPLQPGEPDALELTAIASGLALFLRNDKTRPPLVIAVNGRWGSGKSSLMNLVRAQLEAAGSRPVWFNAWHHQKEDQLLAALLDAVKKQAVPTVGSRAGFMFRVRLAWARLRQSWFEASLAVAAVVLLWQAESYLKLNHEAYSFGHLLHQMFGSLFGQSRLESGQLKELLETTDKWIATGGAVLFALTRAMRGIRAFASDPSSLLAGDAPATSAKRLQDQTAFRQRFAREFADVTRALGAQRMLIVIDDLDRCRPEKVREVLEAVNFLVSSGECFVILGMAREIVRHCVGLSFARVVDTMPWEAFDLPADDIQRALQAARTSFGVARRGPKRPNVTVAAKRAAFAELFLDKLVQIEISIPEPTPKQKARLFDTVPPAKADERAARWLKIGSSVTNTLQPVVCAAVVAFAVIAFGFQVGQRFDSLWPVADVENFEARQTIDAEAQSLDGSPAGGSLVTNDNLDNGGAATGNNGRGAGANGSAPSSLRPGVPGYLAAGAAIPVRWYSSWPFGLAVLALVAAGIGALRRVPQQRVADSAAFAKAIAKWHPIVLTEGARNTPRTARRFQNRVRYLAMRQRALEEGPQVSPAEQLVRWLVGAKSGKPAPLMRLDDKQSTPYEQWKHTRESALERPVYIPEETLVALAAIHQFEPEWVTDEEQFKRHVVDGTDATSHAFAAALKELPHSQQPHLTTYRESYLRLSSDVDQPIAAPTSAPAAAPASQSASPMPQPGAEHV